MKVGIFINTPSQVHFYRNIKESLEERGHETSVLARSYGETIPLLKEYEIEFNTYSTPSQSKFSKAARLPLDVRNAARILGRGQVDVVTGFGIYDAYSAALLRVPDIVFNDTEPSINNGSYAVQFKIFMPFVRKIITPSFFKDDLGKKQIRIPAIKELAYLHPNHFTPNPDVLDMLGVAKDENYVMLRFNAFDAVHDLGFHGFTTDEKRYLIKQLGREAKVFVTSESGLPNDLKKYLMRIPKHKFHDALSFAKMCVTETGTMTSEAAVLGTPAILLHPKVNLYGNFVQLRDRYGLILTHTDAAEAISEALLLAKIPNLKTKWKAKRDRYLSHSIDPVDFMVSSIEGSPVSLDNVDVEAEEGILA